VAGSDIRRASDARPSQVAMRAVAIVGCGRLYQLAGAQSRSSGAIQSERAAAGEEIDDLAMDCRFVAFDWSRPRSGCPSLSAIDIRVKP